VLIGGSLPTSEQAGDEGRVGAGVVVVERDSRYDRQQPALIRHGEGSR